MDRWIDRESERERERIEDPVISEGLRGCDLRGIRDMTILFSDLRYVI